MAIDATNLPPRSLFDSSALIPALRRGPGDEKAAELFDVLIATKREILIPTPTVAEVLRGDPSASIPRVRYVRVVSFDLTAAEILGLRFPADSLTKQRDAEGGELAYYKYDALIIAIALRHRVDCFISRDHRQLKKAAAMGLTARQPDAFEALQLQLLPSD